MELSEYVTIAFNVPESHADKVREAMGKAGGGKIGNYSYCSFSMKGVGRFKPEAGADPYIGKQGSLSEEIEEHIETVCKRSELDQVLNAIKKAHPYEEMVIDIFPIYECGRKKAK